MALAVPVGAGRHYRPSAQALPGRPFPLPDCVIDASAGGLASEHIVGIDLSHECLAGRGLHSHLALRSNISLIGEIERGEARNAVVDRQSRCHGEIWASRSRGAHVLGETANVGSIEVSRRLGLGFRRGSAAAEVAAARKQRWREPVRRARISVSSVPPSKSGDPVDHTLECVSRRRSTTRGQTDIPLISGSRGLGLPFYSAGLDSCSLFLLPDEIMGTSATDLAEAYRAGVVDSCRSRASPLGESRRP